MSYQIETQGARNVFANDYLIVADNDHTQYKALCKLSLSLGVVELSDTMREQYEKLCGRVFDLMAAKGAGFSEFDKCLIMQLLAGWGTDAFDTIARELKDREI